jgi:hypothetical protein
MTQTDWEKEKMKEAKNIMSWTRGAAALAKEFDKKNKKQIRKDMKEFARVR